MLQVLELSSGNNYPQNFVNHCINKFLNKLFMPKDLNFIVSRRESAFVLPYLSKTLLDLRTELARANYRKRFNLL